MINKIISKMAKTPCKIFYPDGILDGQTVYREVDAICFEFDASHADFGAWGNVHYDNEILIPPELKRPEAGGRITIGDKTYDIKRVEQFTSIQGRNCGYCLLVLKGA